jgi:hypothetical protein
MPSPETIKTRRGASGRPLSVILARNRGRCRSQREVPCLPRRQKHHPHLAPRPRDCRWGRGSEARTDCGKTPPSPTQCRHQRRPEPHARCSSRPGVSSQPVETPAYQRSSGHLAQRRVPAAARIRPREQRATDAREAPRLLLPSKSGGLDLLPLFVRLSSERVRQAVRQDCSFAKKQASRAALLIRPQQACAEHRPRRPLLVRRGGGPGPRCGPLLSSGGGNTT